MKTTIFSVIAGIFLLTCLSGVQTDGVCDPGWIAYDNFCYLFVTTKSVTNDQAQQECLTQGGYLVRVLGNSDTTWLTGQMKKSFPSSGFWTDLNDKPKGSTSPLGTGKWKWGSNQYADMSYISWNQSPANDGQSTCGAVNVQGKVADLKCAARQGYICKYATSSGCTLGWLPTNTGCYWVSNTSDPSQLKTWKEASQTCANKAQGATLLVLNSQDDVTFLQQQIPYMASTTKTYWIGLTYNNGNWGWSNNQPVGNIPIPWQKEPDNVAGRENCGILRMTGKFSDRDCSSGANYICQKSVYQYNPAFNIGCGNWIRAGKMCVVFSVMKKTWSDARAYCQLYGSDLLKVDSFDKMSWLTMQMLDPANLRFWWTGLNDQASDGTYVWADGTMANQTFIKWNQEPNDWQGMEDCAVIYTTGQYNDVTCDVHAAAICELDNQQTCPDNTWIQHGGNCYLFTPYNNVSVLYQLSEAASFCATFATSATNVATLISVDSKDEHDFLRQQVTSAANRKNIYGWWTSLNDKQSEGFWSYASGPVMQKGLIDWQGEPSTAPGDNCGLVTYNGNFHERDCTRKISFICERYATGVTQGSSSIQGSIFTSLLVVLLVLLR